MAINGDMFSLAETQVFIPEIWSTEIFRYRMEMLILAQYCKRMNFMGRAGDLIRMPRISRLGVRPKVLKAPVEYQSITENEWTMTVNRYMESSFMIEDIVNIQAHTNLRQEYTRETGLALARDIDYRVMAERAAIIGADATSHIVSTVPLAKADILAAIEILDRRRVPKEGRVFIITPAHYSSLLNIDELINMDYVNNAPVETGMIGRVYGIPVVVDNNITINSLTGLKNGDNSPVLKPTPGMTGSDYFPDQEDGTVTSLTANYYSAMLLHSDCITLAMQQMPKTTSAFDIDYQANKVVSTQLYDVKLYRPDHGCIISTDEDNLV
jgi:N4-gp56 family major capsid protein